MTLALNLIPVLNCCSCPLRLFTTTIRKVRLDNSDNMLQSPSAERNKEPMLNVLKDHLAVDKKGQVLEIASGSGTQIALFAENFPLMTWQPSEIDTRCLER